MSKYYLIFGSIAGLCSFILEYLLYGGYLGYDKMGGVLFGKLLALVGCITFAVVLIKKLRGGISFMRTSFSGFMIAIVCSAVSGIGYSYMHYPDGSFFHKAQDYAVEQWLEQNAENPEELAKEFEMRKEFANRFSLKYHTMLELGMYLAFGIIFSAVLAGIMADRKSLAG